VIDEVEQDEDHHQHEWENEHHGFDEAALVLELAGHLVGHAFHIDAFEFLFHLLDEAAEVAVLDVCLDVGAEQAVFRGDFIGADFTGDFWRPCRGGYRMLVERRWDL
jgi:hypothetical protein